jgi:hypothetical protein
MLFLLIIIIIITMTMEIKIKIKINHFCNNASAAHGKNPNLILNVTLKWGAGLEHPDLPQNILTQSPHINISS